MEKFSATNSTVFTPPIRQLVLMLIVLGLIAAGVSLAYAPILSVFLTNPLLNGFIALVFTIGVLSCFWQVLQLFQSVRWIRDFVQGRLGLDFSNAPRLLAPLAALLGARGAKTTIPSSSAASILDSVATRIDEGRDITRYLSNLLIFLGLLGTFYGLATAVPAMVETIRGLTPQPGESGIDVFAKLMNGLQSQLGAMGTAFSSSLLGLAGSLVVGLLDLLASHGQNRFYRELEEWLSSITRLGFGAAEADGQVDAGQLIGILETLAGQMEALQTLHAQAELSRAMLEERLGRLADAVEGAADKSEQSDAFARLADGQDRLIGAVDRLAQGGATAAAMQAQTDLLVRMVEGQDRLAAALASPDSGAGIDAENRMRLRSIDVQLLRILEEISAGRQESMADLRADLSALTSAIRQTARTPLSGRT